MVLTQLIDVGILVVTAAVEAPGTGIRTRLITPGVADLPAGSVNPSAVTSTSPQPYMKSTRSVTCQPEVKTNKKSMICGISGQEEAKDEPKRRLRQGGLAQIRCI